MSLLFDQKNKKTMSLLEPNALNSLMTSFIIFFHYVMHRELITFLDTNDCIFPNALMTLCFHAIFADMNLTLLTYRRLVS